MVGIEYCFWLTVCIVVFWPCIVGSPQCVLLWFCLRIFVGWTFVLFLILPCVLLLFRGL
jgi:hypothetical protein